MWKNKKFISIWHICKQHNLQKESHSFIYIKTPCRQFNTIACNGIGPFTLPCSEGNSYVLPCMCPLTNFPVAIPIPNIADRNSYPGILPTHLCYLWLLLYLSHRQCWKIQKLTFLKCNTVIGNWALIFYPTLPIIKWHFRDISFLSEGLHQKTHSRQTRFERYHTTFTFSLWNAHASFPPSF